MRHDSEVEVLVVGAGPVGMVTALQLARAGIKIRIIDKANGDTTRAYACVLHARSMNLFDELGLADEIKRRGQRINALRCYNGPIELADLDFEPGGGAVFVLPQSELENLLESRLADFGITVGWSQRLSYADLAHGRPTATIDQLGSSGSGYAVPHFDQVINRTSQIAADFIVGADGRDSHVRELLNINLKPVAPPSFYHMCEILSRDPLPDEIRVVVDSSTANSFTPLSKNRGRWIFQVAPEELPDDAHLKDRGHFRIINPRSGELEFFQQLIELRAPWFEAHVDDIEWHGTVSFQPMAAEYFGRDRAWLAGDAAHIAGPIGMQSMNVGLSEGAELGKILAALLRRQATLEDLSRYNADCRFEWERLLNPTDLFNKQIGAKHVLLPAHRLLQCLPASAQHLETLFDQLGIQFQACSQRHRRLHKHVSAELAA